jgi:hypothetical protein
MAGDLGGLNLLFGKMGHRFLLLPESGLDHMASVPWYGIKRKDRTLSERSQKRREWGWKPSATISAAGFSPSLPGRMAKYADTATMICAA